MCSLSSRWFFSIVSLLAAGWDFSPSSYLFFSVLATPMQKDDAHSRLETKHAACTRVETGYPLSPPVICIPFVSSYSFSLRKTSVSPPTSIFLYPFLPYSPTHLFHFLPFSY